MFLQRHRVPAAFRSLNQSGCMVVRDCPIETITDTAAETVTETARVQAPQAYRDVLTTEGVNEGTTASRSTVRESVTMNSGRSIRCQNASGKRCCHPVSGMLVHNHQGA